MRLLSLLILVGWIQPTLAYAQFTPVLEGGARAVALGGSHTTLREDAWGHGNPASWATLTGSTFSVFASQLFGLQEMRLGALVFVQPTSLGTFAGGARTFGFEAYRETRFTAGYSRAVTLGTDRRFFGAVSMRYHHLVIQDYGSAGTVSLSAGGLVELVPSVDFGFYAGNVYAPALANREPLPRTLALGLAYRPARSFHVLIDAFKDVRTPLSLSTGVEVQPVDAFALRFGIATNPVRFTTGAGLQLGILSADLAAARHEQLGWSPFLSLGLHW